MTKNVLLVGESWITSETHFKGFDNFSSAHYHTGAEPFLDAVRGEEFDVTYMPSHEAVTDLPFDRAGLDRWDVILISDIGANSLLLPPDVFLRSERRPNRLKLLRDWTHDGGGLMMVGGYLTFQGIDGSGRWHRTPVEDALPVTCLPYDDRIEAPEGIVPEIAGDAAHPILEGVPGDWPFILGANEIVARDGAEVLVRLPEAEGGHPLLVTGEYGKGRSIAWASDMAPHWLPPEFLAWGGYRTIWLNMLRWLART
ncbi:glutamine amidotransferase [uncultured Jannaschia sp.]|uniref:glutamine amidotransferase n=1 Tax=uncultured Jannaschia sp. TaxID=293347 RepID=UPI0026106996|nr:glutamine amidotransferase [uncultured Jannaschia sp.]